MITFMDTNLFKKNSVIHVIVYSDSIELAKRKIDSLILGENIIEIRESINDYQVLVSKGEIVIFFRVLPLSTNTRGHRSQFALVDRNIIGHEYGKEIFNETIRSKTMLYSHLFKDDDYMKTNDIVNIMLF